MSRAEELKIKKGGKIKQIKLALYLPSQLSVDYNKLYKSIEWENEKVKSHGISHVLNREVARYGKDIKNYNFGGYKRKPIKIFPRILDKIWKFANEIIKELIEDHPDFNFVVCNYYRDGCVNIGYHTDGTDSFVENSVIMSMSFGASRDFLISENESNKKYSIKLNDGDIFIMKYGFQDLYKHSLPTRRKVNEGRVNLTFRVKKQ